MIIALVASLIIVLTGKLFPGTVKDIIELLQKVDFSKLLMGSMLSFMLFAGAIHIRLDELREQRLAVLLFSTLSVLLSTFIIGIAVYYLLPVFHIHAPFIYCLLFGSLISPTDPIAVMGIFKEVKIPKSLEMKIAGESLFNDGVAVVIFLTIFEVAHQPESSVSFVQVAGLFLREAVGGIALGIAIGYLGLLLMKSIDNYKIEVLITLAIVMGGYSLANFLDISGPLAMVAAGIITGNQGKKVAMSEITKDHVVKFWELIDDILNSILFVLIGLELLLINSITAYLFAGSAIIVLVLVTRYISVWLPSLLIRFHEKMSRKTLFILTWGGLRGGISIALALTLKPEMMSQLWVSLTYMIVVFSIIVQGLTIGKVSK